MIWGMESVSCIDHIRPGIFSVRVTVRVRIRVRLLHLVVGFR
jgi:hypothetical protein